MSNFMHAQEGIIFELKVMKDIMDFFTISRKDI